MSGFGGVIKLQGEKEYKAALQQIRQSLRETGSSLTAISSSFKYSNKSMDETRAAADRLTVVMKKQIQDNENLRAAYNKMNAIYKQNEASIASLSKSYQDEKAKLDAIEKSLGKTSPEYNEQAKVVAKLEQNLEKETKKQEENEVALSRMRIELNNSEAAFAKTAMEVENLEKAMSENAEATKKSSTAYGSLQSTIENQESKLKSLKNEYKNVVLEQGENSQSAKNLASQISNLSGELNENKTKLNNAEKAADELSKSMDDVGNSAEGATGGFTVFKGALANLVANTIQNAIGKLKELASTTIEAGMKFDTAMSQVSAISGATGDELSQLRDKAKEMGSTTKFTATESAEAFNYMAIAGWKTEDMLNGIDGVLNLAAASGSDLATTSDIVTDALTAMGYKAGDAGKLADVMAAASSNANTNVEMMGHTFQYAAPIVGALGYNMEDTAVAIGLMANAGIKAEKAGTALRSVLTRLSAPPKECEKAMNALGISIKNTDGTMKPLNEVIGDLRKSFDGLSEAEQTQYAKNLAGQEAMSGLLAIVNAAPEDYDKLTKAVENSSGAAQKMADTMLNNTEGGFTLLKSNIEGVQIAIYEKFEPALRKGIEILNGLTNAVRFVVDHSGEFTAALTAMTAGIGAYVAYTTALKVMKNGWMSLSIAQKAVTAAQWLMNAAMNANPIGLVIAAVAALTAGFITLWNKSESFRKFWIDLWENIKKITKSVVDSITKWFSETWSNIKKVWSEVSGFFSQKWNDVKAVFGKAKDFFRNAFSSAWSAVKNVFSNWGNFFGGLWNTIKDKFSSIGTSIANAIGGAVKKGINGVISMIENTINSAIGLINGAINLINKIPGLNIGNIKKLSLPKLARGGVLDDGARTVIAGEDGAEAIVPLEKNTKWIKILANQLQDSFLASSQRQNVQAERQTQTEYNMLVNSFKQALSEMTVEMDDETMGRFVERTVANAIYS